MKTICIETKPESSIGGGIRFSDSPLLYTTYQGNISNPIRNINLNRFGKTVRQLTRKQVSAILKDVNNIQIISNDGSVKVEGLYDNTMRHPILIKSGLISLFSDIEGLSSFLPKTIIIPSNKLTIDNMVNEIKKKISENFQYSEYDMVVIKNAGIDGNGNGVGFIDLSKDNIEKQITDFLAGITKKMGSAFNIVEYDYLIQEHIENITGEGSITFSIQNIEIQNWGIVNNIVIQGEYFASTNIFQNITLNNKMEIEQLLGNKLLPLLQKLQLQGVRGNIGFDFLYKKNDKDIIILILESNGIYRTTGSTLPNSFAYNTGNQFFLGIPISIKYLDQRYHNLSYQSLARITHILEGIGTDRGKKQAILLKCDGVEWGYPVFWISFSAEDRNDLLENPFNGIKIFSNSGQNYINKIMESINAR